MIFDITLPCGLRLWCAHQPDGVGNIKEHVGEYLWCVESGTKVHARSYAADAAAARLSALHAARVVLSLSAADLSTALLGGCQ